MKTETGEQRCLILDGINKEVITFLNKLTGIKVKDAHAKFDKFVMFQDIKELDNLDVNELKKLVKQAVLMAVLTHEGIIK